jgi:hypothetical protein
MASAGSPVVHSVHFYEHDDALIQRLGSVVASALAEGGTALLIMTPEHRDQLCRFLTKRAIDTYSFERSGRLHILDAQETLNAFMLEGLPSPQLYHAVVGQLARELVADSTSLTAFGEMVALLWKQGNKEGALELEALWNQLLSESSFHLHCAYAKSLFRNDEKRDIQSICDHHSLHVGFETA